MAVTWATPDDARKFWRDAPADEDVLSVYLGAARVAVEAFAPALPEDAEELPDNYLLAQIMQARNTWNAGKASPSTGDFDGGGFGISAMPLDWQIKQLLRPQRGLGAIA